MLKRIALLFLPLLMYGENIVVAEENYNIIEDENNSYIFSKEYEPFMPLIREYQKDIIKRYNREFGFNFDDTLRTILASNNNQIANGFSTQFPFNMQVFYNAGISDIDYFCSSSWIKELMIHETAHNFQLNPKDNIVSDTAHKIVGNNPLVPVFFVPVFPVPNIMINSFLLEGNSVLNESRFGIGGRLYSGYALAELVVMAKAGKIKPNLLYNTTLNFPYSENYYLIGGFFQYFLAKKYGIKKVNGFFKNYSKQPFPFWVNSTFKETFGEDFEKLLGEFEQYIKDKYASFKVTNGDVIALSQIFVPMNSNEKEIYTLIGDKKSYPKILNLNKETKKVTFKRGAYKSGKVFKIDNKYYTISSAKVSPTKIKMGLVDRDSYLKKGTEGKVIQGFLSNSKVVYFDVLKSLDVPHIYIDGKFYDTSNSSVYVKGDDLYYFKQNDKTRTLYKNKKPLFSYIGYYGFVTDISENGDIYFISLTKNGSGAYSFVNNKIKKVASGDDIIDLKLINNKEALVITISNNGYKYQIIDLNPKPSSIPKPDIMFREQNNSSYNKSTKNIKKETIKKAKKYYPIDNLEFSYMNPYYGYSDSDGDIFGLSINFTDSLIENSFGLLFYSDKNKIVGGTEYINTQYPLEFGGRLYLVAYSYDYDSSNERDNGYWGFLNYPFLSTGYWKGSAKLEYTKDFDNIYRKPLVFSTDIDNIKQFGISKYPNSKNSLDIFISHDRGDNGYGGNYSFEYGLPYQSFISLDATYMKSNKVDAKKEKGIEINHNFGDIQTEKLAISMPNIEYTRYAKELKVGAVGAYKTFDTPLYFFSFPLSLQRESIYLKQRLYDIDFLNENKKYHETTLGVESDFVFFNNFVAPIKFEFLYNRDVEDKRVFRVFFSGEF